MHLVLNEKIKKVFDFFNTRSVSIFLVGGTVRNLVMGDENVTDIDIASGVPPEELIRLCEAAGAKVIPTGLTHGTVTILFDFLHGEKIEHTTFRKDVHCDGRHAEVQFTTDLQEDLSRRDFTINSMAVGSDGILIDPFGGEGDIISGVLRATGNIDKRLQEDYLRLLRGVRFAAKYNLTIADRYSYGAHSVHLMEKVAVERIVEELKKGLEHNPGNYIYLLDTNNLLVQIIPEFARIRNLRQNPKYHPEGSVLNHIMEVLERTPVPYRLHALFHDIGKPLTGELSVKNNNEFYHFYGHDAVGAKAFLVRGKELKLSNAEIASIYTVIKYHMKLYTIKKKNKLRQLSLDIVGHEEALQAVFHADHPGNKWPDFEPIPEWPSGEKIAEKLQISLGPSGDPRIGEELKRIKAFWVQHGRLPW